MRFLDACLGLPVDTTPIWLMRQAGRYLPEYRALREKASFLEMCKDPDLVVEATLQPLRRFDFDAAIIFSDILIPLEAMGVPVDFVPEPRLPRPVRSREEVRLLREFDPLRDTGFLMEAISRVRKALNPAKALIGFAGAPFTLAAYLVEGGGSRDFFYAKTWMLRDQDGFSGLMALIADAVVLYLDAQIEAGADAVQLFDTWAGALAPEDFRRLALPWARYVIERSRRPGVPIIYYVGGVAGVLDDVVHSGADCIGIDFRVDLGEAIARFGGQVSVQGNLDPLALFAPEAEVRRRAASLVEAGRAARGHVFNLGHGVHKDTPIAGVEALVDEVHRRGARFRQESST